MSKLTRSLYTGGRADIENGGASCLKDRHRHPKFITGSLGLGLIFGQWVDRLAGVELALELDLYLYIHRSFVDPHDRKSGRLITGCYAYVQVTNHPLATGKLCGNDTIDP